MISAVDISINYGKKPVLKAFNLKAKEGDLVAIIGPNGSGKSSLLRVLAGLQKPDGGVVYWNQRALKEISLKDRPRFTGTLLSTYHRVPGLTVYDAVALGRHPYTGFFGRLDANDRDIIEKAIHTAGVSHRISASLSTLSDGEFRKVMVAKIFAQEAKILILDEPTAHLDLPSSIELIKLLKGLATKENRTICFSSHDLSLVFKIVDRLVLLGENGEWTTGSPNEISDHHLMCNFLKTNDLRILNGNLIFEPKQ